MRIIFISLLLIASTSSSSAQFITPVWTSDFETEGNTPINKTPFLLVDSFNNIIVCGGTYFPGPVHGFLTCKYNAEGQLLWYKTYDTFGQDDIVSAVTATDGSIYVGGNSIDNFNGTTPKFVIIKYNAAGNVEWEYQINEAGIGACYIKQLLFDGNGNLMVFSSVFDIAENKLGLCIIKLAPNGQVIWLHRYIDIVSGYGGINAKQIEGNWLFWGQTTNSSLNTTSYILWKIDDSGETIGLEISQPYPDIFGYPSFWHIGADGSLYTGGGDEFEVIKLDTLAQLGWEFKKSSGSFPPFVVAARVGCIESSSNGEVFVSGLVRHDSVNITMSTVKLSQEGSLIWEISSHFNGFYNVYPEVSHWLNDSLLLLGGNTIINSDSNFYEVYYALFNSDGFLRGWVNDLDGNRNTVISILNTDNAVYTVGSAYPDYFLDPDKQRLCKFNLNTLVNTSETNFSSTASLSIHPNPFHHQCSIEIEHAGPEEDGILQVFNAKGTLVHTRNVRLQPGRQYIRVEMPEGLPGGVYWFRLSGGKVVYQAKAVMSP